ncbi:MAG TPA: AAA family ATPase [Vicinamibacterales bacterium]|jgi:cellulose biosynthesis protein BcsQ|nr:AAA family ATPase [Vicinamibacterales bacterium]
MNVVAIYNMKGGVGKTTTAVNLAYLAAASGQRTLLWDLDPQAASSFAFRVRPRVARFSKKSLESGQSLAEAIKETDYSNLDLLPADFTYRKFDRLLGHFDKPHRVVASLLATIGRDYDVVFLDCPAGFSLLTEGVFAAADIVLVPTIPTVLSLRMVARLIKWADRTESPSQLLAFLSMVDRRKALHQRISEWSAGQRAIFLDGQIPYASVVERMTVRRAPLPLFAPRDAATLAFGAIWGELQTRLQQREERSSRPRSPQVLFLEAIRSLILRLESADGRAARPRAHPYALDDVASGDRGLARDFVHRFDTDRLDLERSGYVIELRERAGSILLVVGRSAAADDGRDMAGWAQAQIDRSWATQILSGAMSPLDALQSRLGAPDPVALEPVRALLAGRSLRRVDSRVDSHTGEPRREHLSAATFQPPTPARRWASG